MATPSNASPSRTLSSDKNSDKNNLEFTIASVNKQFGEGSLMRMNEAKNISLSVIPTGCIAVDLALGVGGLPRGRVVEIFGPESSGKTTFCLSVIAQVQKQGGSAAFVDVEHALDPRYAKVVGVDLDSLLVSQPSSGEDALNIVEMLVASRAIDIVVLDSVAALVSKAELEGQMGDVTVGAQARLMSQAMRKLTSVISKTNCICLFTNQIREKIGVMFGSPETTPGGRALKFFSSIRMDIRRTGQIKETSGKIVGNRTRLKIVKNKVAPPYTECEFDIMYDEGISQTGAVLDLALDIKVLEKKGSWIAYKGTMIGQGREAAKKYLADNPTVLKELLDLILNKAKVSCGSILGGTNDSAED